MSRVITISREFGSGGREVGFRLAEKLGIPFYDKEIISMAAEDTNISEMESLTALLMTVIVSTLQALMPNMISRCERFMAWTKHYVSKLA